MSLRLKKAKGILEKSPHVERITEKNVSYTAEFKKHATEEYNKGISPIEIFEQAGFDVSIFPADYPRSTLKRWRTSVQKNGINSLSEDNRGKGSSGRPRTQSTKDLSESELRARVAYLEAEVDFLKKLRALARKGK